MNASVTIRRLATLATLSLILTQCTRTDLAHVGKARLKDSDNGETVRIAFDLKWPHSFRDAVNWDAVWIFAKYRVDEGPWRHATLSDVSTDFSVESDNGVQPMFEAAQDGRGVLGFRAGVGNGPIAWNGVSLVWRHADDGVQMDGADVQTQVFAIEMVHIPEGPFFLGDGEQGNVSGHFGSPTGADPFFINSENALILGGTDPNGLGTNNGHGMDEAFVDDFSERVTTTLPAPFPKGYIAFYIMKHELTEGLYAEFLNTLTETQQGTLNPAEHESGPRPGNAGYGLTTMPPFISSVPDRPATWLTWSNAAAFADWAGLRPFTEFEFEKAARGNAQAVAGEFAWGSVEISTRPYAIMQTNTPAERVVDPPVHTGNALYQATSGFTEDCASCRKGPLMVGAFSEVGLAPEERGTNGSGGVSQGVSFYGVMELSGNLWERVVTIGNPAGRRFAGTHGDGEINDRGRAAGTEVMLWPGTSNTGNESQIIGSVGTGLRGGGWDSPASNLRISSREFAATPDNRTNPRYGYRFARTSRRSVVAMPDSARSP